MDLDRSELERSEPERADRAAVKAVRTYLRFAPHRRADRTV